jgi:hypothetical protein
VKTQPEIYFHRGFDFGRFSGYQVWLVLPLLDRLNGSGNQHGRPAHAICPVYIAVLIYVYTQNDHALNVLGLCLRRIDWFDPVEQTTLHGELQNTDTYASHHAAGNTSLHCLFDLRCTALRQRDR